MVSAETPKISGRSTTATDPLSRMRASRSLRRRWVASWLRAVSAIREFLPLVDSRAVRELRKTIVLVDRGARVPSGGARRGTMGVKDDRRTSWET